MTDVRMVHLDSFNFPRLDLLKIDVEGMELEVLEGAAKCIGENRPIMLVEALKTDPTALRARLEGFGYTVFPAGMNFIAFHKEDKCMEGVKFIDAATARRTNQAPAIDNLAKSSSARRRCRRGSRRACRWRTKIPDAFRHWCGTRRPSGSSPW